MGKSWEGAQAETMFSRASSSHVFLAVPSFQCLPDHTQVGGLNTWASFGASVNTWQLKIATSLRT